MPHAASAADSICLSCRAEIPQPGWLQVDEEKPEPEKSLVVILEILPSCLSKGNLDFVLFCNLIVNSLAGLALAVYVTPMSLCKLSLECK